MSFSVIPHKNTIFFYLLLNLAGYDKDTKFPKHPLRVKIEADWFGKELPKQFESFRNFYSNNGSPLHIYNFTQWAIFTDDNLELLSDLQNSTFQESAVALFNSRKEMFQLLKSELDFDDYYESLVTKYKEYSNEIVNYTNEASFETKMNEFWQMDFEFEFQVIFNPLMEQNRGNGARNDKMIYAALGPTAKTKSETYEFSKSCYGNF